MNHIFKLAFIFIINIIFLINASATTMDKDKFVEVNGIKIHYVEEGEGPPLLLIHGGGLTAKSWQGLASERGIPLLSRHHAGQSWTWINQ